MTDTKIEIERRSRAFLKELAADGIRAAVCVTVIAMDADGDDVVMAYCPPFDASNVEALGIADQMREQARMIAQDALKREALEKGSPDAG